ncbi:hypothetical protein [Cytobacillus sp. IB215316]|uniref:hypothetical protein n=1 Tax=Cytobacillus sp. IB215316 TaxID=3097354 RepID=UPI002A0AB4FA|nr:hypothetical protein [Cytobacillus sp. IB215316]MDX8362650.1 hypothetical protein [Cytobacillus sp. IB215316]
MITAILAVIFMIPIYALLIWTYISPEESMLFGNRWMYKEEPELSEEVIRYRKFISLMIMIGLPIVIISFMFELYFLRFISIIGLAITFMFGILKIFK